MSGIFMKLKKLVIPIITLVILTSQLSGCAIMTSKEMINMINNGETIAIELAIPEDGELAIEDDTEELDWVQLDQLKTHNTGYRQLFDEVFNINIVTENGVNGKSGSLYVDEDADRNGNTTIEDALRNKIFVEEYWQDVEVQTTLAKVAIQAYSDLGTNDKESILASLNAYYDLIDGEETDKFNAAQSLSREQFYALVFRSEEGVKELAVDSSYADAIGGETKYSRFAQEVDQFAFLSVDNKSLDSATAGGAMSIGEAVYMLVNKHFPDKLQEVTGKEKAFSDTKNAGDIAYKVGFKEKDKETGNIIAKDKWQSYTLAFMMQYPEKGMEESMYKAMVVAKDLGLITEDESRWDEPISKVESIQLIVNTHLAKNKAYGYLSEVEYGKINTDKFKIANGSLTVLGKDEDTGLEHGEGWTEIEDSKNPSDPNKVLSNGITLGDFKGMLEIQRDLCKQEGMSDSETNKILEQLAKDFGTTLSEVNRVVVSEAPVIVDKPSVGGNTNSGNSNETYVPPSEPIVNENYVPPSQPSGGGGETYVPPAEPSGGGNISSEFEGNIFDAEGVGSGEDNPDFNLEAN